MEGSLCGYSMDATKIGGPFKKENNMDFRNAYRTFTDVFVILVLAILLGLVSVKERLGFNHVNMRDPEARN